MRWMLWILGLLLLAVFAWLSALNASVFWKQTIRKVRTPSWIPLIGGLVGALAFRILPVPFLNAFWWLPLLLDTGCLPGLLYTLIWHLVRMAAHSK